MLTWKEGVEAAGLRKRGWSISAIACYLGRDRKTIPTYLTGMRESGKRVRPTPDAMALLDGPRDRGGELPHAGTPGAGRAPAEEYRRGGPSVMHGRRRSVSTAGRARARQHARRDA
jgi:hypothetical protein